MKEKMAHFLKTSPVFAWLLPVFFVLHGYNEFYPLIPVKDSIILTVVYLLAAFVLFGLYWLVFRNKYKSALVAFLLLGLNFFFGPAHDWLKHSFSGAFFTRYIFLLPALFIFFLVLAIYLKKRKQTFYRATQYLNILLFVLLLIDIIAVSTKALGRKNSFTDIKKEFTDCSGCKKPDIYYILADEYGGFEQLKNVFGFDNSGFENELRKRGFHVIKDSRSNYNYTMFSAASILNMDYIAGIEGRNQSIHDRKICTEVMNNNRVFRFFESIGYQTYNYSIFDIPGQPTMAKPSFLPVKTRPLINQTLLYRISRDLWFHLVTDLKMSSAEMATIYNDKKNNSNFIQLTKERAVGKNNTPKFVYTHLIMPHYPYYFDKDGNERSYKDLGGEFNFYGDWYISYLQYCNKKFLELIDHIRTNSATPPVIIFMSDHGYRSFKNYDKKETYFTNINSVFVPDSNYSSFYNGMSNVNQFRVLLNTQFKQNLPLLKDSTSFLRE